MAKKAARRGRVKKTTEPELIELGQRIRELRIAKGYTSAEMFAYDHKLSRTSYTQCERGSNLTYMSLRRLLDIFGVSVQEFFAPLKK